MRLFTSSVIAKSAAMKQSLAFIFLLMVFYLQSCGMLKNTSKDRTIAKTMLSTKAELQQLDLSKAYRESKIYSYRADGSVAAFEHRKEHVDAASLIKMQTEKKLEQKASTLNKQSSPNKLWTAGLLIVLVIIALLIIKNQHF